MESKEERIASIAALLEGMNDVQLANVFKYVSNEFDEENHEARYQEVRQGNWKTLLFLEWKKELLNDPQIDPEKKEWAQGVLSRIQEKGASVVPTHTVEISGPAEMPEEDEE